MADKASILREAHKHLAKGQMDKAIAEGEKLADLYPDAASFNFLGDLFLRKGDRKSAIAAFHRTADLFRQEGFSLKALALYKKILNINPSDAEALVALGELNEEKEIVTDAIKYFLAAADIFSKEGRKRELLGVYDKILNLAPSNIPLRIKVSELFSKEGFVSEASREYLQIGMLFEERSEVEKAKEYFTRAAEIQPGNYQTHLSLARVYEGAGEADRAASFVRNALKSAGGDPSVVVTCAEMLAGLGLEDEALSEALKVAEKDPSNQEAAKFVSGLYRKRGEVSKAWQHLSSAMDGMMKSEDLDEVVGILEEFKDAEPIEARLKLVALLRRAGRTDYAVKELSTLRGFYDEKGMAEEAMRCLAEALELQPDNAELLELKRSLAGTAPEEPEAPGAEAAVEAEEEITVEQEEEDALAEAEMYIRHSLYDKAMRVLEALKVKDPGNVEVHLKLKSVYLETGDKEQAIAECLILSELYSRAGDEDKKIDLLKEARGINPNDPRLAERLAAVPELAAAAPSVEDYQDDLFEADFYLNQGFFSEAREILSRLAEKFPDDESLRAKLQEAMQGAGHPAGPEEVPAAAGADTAEGGAGAAEEAAADAEISFGEAAGTDEAPPQEEKAGEAPTEELPADIAVEADEMKEPALDNDVLEIFEEFKKGLEKEVEAEDSETHYNLGIAYKEMELIDDAINSFQISKHDPKFFVQSASMLGVCYMQKGLHQLAVNAFSSALMKTDPQEEASWGLKYELADAYMKNGNLQEALQLFTEVYGWNSKFREVSEKINSLRKAIENEASHKGKKSRVSYL
jgi:tetratricopeptide (TPR) repeat protein